MEYMFKIEEVGSFVGELVLILVVSNLFLKAVVQFNKEVLHLQ